MTDLCETAILQHLESHNAIEDTYPWSQTCGLDHKDVVGAVKSLLVEEYVASKDLSESYFTLSKEADSIVQNGAQEIIVLQALNDATKMTMPELQAKVGADVAKIGMGNCMKNQWVQKDGADLVPRKTMQEVTDEVQMELQLLLSKQGDPTALDDKVSTFNILPCLLLIHSLPVVAFYHLALTHFYHFHFKYIDKYIIMMMFQILTALKRRKLITLVTRKSLHVTKGTSYSPVRVKKAADLTKEMLDSGAWATTPFKPYNFLTLGEKVGGGYLHPLLKVRAEFRKILMQMGFSEMPTNKWVESSFWNFDTLFQPQSHPARDAHDTFFIQDPAVTVSVPEDYYERVKTMHEVGGAGSIGYRYDFKREEAFKNLLRTHTTAISSQMLYRLANQEGGFQPAKYFSIDRVFRNETMDATHLCEFHQVEGLVADYDLSLGDLIGTIETFFNKIGITQLRFKPAFNPYTEPSMEVFGYHPILKKWTEIGNSGMFRPEMLEPMGLPPNVRVIAWGLSLERPTMIKYKIDNIRDLFGHKVEMARTKTAPVCRF